MNIDPAFLARADQDLALTRQKLQVILDLWATDRLEYPDPVERVCRLIGFMSESDAVAVHALLAVALERLAEQEAA